LYDQRNHGQSGGKDTTYGYYEKYDLYSLVDWVYRNLGDGALVGTMGESLGAAISIQHAAVDPRISFVISDSSFSDLKTQFKYRLNYDYRLSAFPFINLADFFTTILTGLSFDSVSPERDCAAITQPALFIHGSQDKYIPPSMAQRLFNKKVHGIKKLLIAPNARHCESFISNRELYDETIGDFLEEIGMMG
jgi:fermentation-respiration switch protein FrsA (DUF1100 family)